MVAEKIIVVPGIHHGLQEHAYDLEMPHIAKAPVGGVDASTNDPKPAVGDFFAEKVVLRVESAFIEAAQAVKHGLFEKHEHTGAERANHDRAILSNVIGEVQDVVAHGPLAAPDVGSDAVESPSRDQVHGAAEQRGVFQFHVRIKEQNVRSGSPVRSGVASDRGKPAGYYFNVQPVSE